MDEATDWLEVGIDLPDPGGWGQGVGALGLWSVYLFEHPAMARIGVSTWSGTERMMRLAATLGMRQDARIRLVRKVDGARYYSLKCGILSREWPPPQ